MLALPIHDLPTRSASGFIIRYVLPRSIPPQLVGPLDKKVSFSTLTIGDAIIGVGHGDACYSKDTEILTEDGWMAFSKLKGDEKVATLNPKTNELKYQNIIRRYIFFYQGKMFHQDGDIDLLVTPNHNLYCSWLSTNSQYRPFTFVKAKHIGRGLTRDPKTGRFASQDSPAGALKFKRDARWHGKQVNYFILPGTQYNIVNQAGDCGSKQIPPTKIKMNDFLRFFGIWLAEGCTSIGKGNRKRKSGKVKSYCSYRITITQNNQWKRNLIKKWLQPIANQVGFKFWEHKNNHSRGFEARNKQLFQYLRQFGKAQEKYIPKEILALSSEQLNILLYAMMLGDGSGKTYFTSSKKLANDVQEIALKTGRAASIRKTKKGIYRVGICDDNSLNPLCQKGNEWVDYNGFVYCVEVPDHHTLYVRRNGKPCWCGNSEFCGHNDQVILDTLSIPDVKDKVVVLISCETAQELGPALINAGAASYIGFKDDLVWVCDADLASTPWSDKMALTVMGPITDCVNIILDGKTVGEAYATMLNQLSANAGVEEDELIRSCLEFNRGNAILLGDGSAKMRARPPLVLPFTIVPPPPIIWPVAA